MAYDPTGPSIFVEAICAGADAVSRRARIFKSEFSRCRTSGLNGSIGRSIISLGSAPWRGKCPRS
jgi:hypothetical protein